jgi:L-2-hydroxyglutarate oxidase LhgO
VELLTDICDQIDENVIAETHISFAPTDRRIIRVEKLVERHTANDSIEITKPGPLESQTTNIKLLENIEPL